MRHATEDQLFIHVFPVQDGSGGFVTGLTSFTVVFLLDGVVETPAFTVAEVGASGVYVLRVESGFELGTWAVSIQHPSLNPALFEIIEVSKYSLDAVYERVNLPSTVVVELSVEADSDPVPGCNVHVYASDVFVTWAVTDLAGEASFLLPPGDYTARMYKPGVVTGTDTFTVPAEGGSVVVEAESLVVTSPGSPQVCRLYGDFFSQRGTPLHRFKIIVENLYDPTGDLSVVQRQTDYATDEAGHVEFDLVRGMMVRVSLVTTNMTREFTVPDQPVANLLTLVGSTTDAFAVGTP